MQDQVIAKALDSLAAIEARPRVHLPSEIVNKIFAQIPGLLPALRAHA
jgi:hypothetical protein